MKEMSRSSPVLEADPGGSSGRQAPVVVWLRLGSAAVLVDSSAEALRKRLNRTSLPPGIVKRWGRSLLIHRERFLAWLAAE